MLDSLLWNQLLTTAAAIVLAALCRLAFLDRRPALRHWLWLLLLAKLVTPPLVSVPLLPAVANEDTPTVATTSRGPAGDHGLASGQGAEVAPAADGATLVGVGDAAGHDGREARPRELQSHQPMPYLVGLVVFSLIVSGVLLTVHGYRAARLYRWLGRLGRENPLLAATCADVASRLGIRRSVRSRVVETRSTPLVWAWRRPLVLVPRRLVEDLGPQELRGLVTHELAHLARRDHWANAFVFVVKALLWWNPVVWWADRELRAAQELCCDAMAIDRSDANRRGYAAALLKALDFIQSEPVGPRALAIGFGTRKSLLRRFEMIGEKRLSYRMSRWTLLALAFLAIPLVCIPVRAQEKGPAATTTSTIAEARPAKADAGAGRDKKEENTFKQQTEEVRGKRPRGNCSISGKVVSAETGKPIEGARVYLFYLGTFSPLFVHTASDGTFVFNNIPTGPFFLQLSHTPGYQDVVYNPNGKPGSLPQFSLNSGEHRSGIVLKAKKACRVSGKVLDEKGKTPPDVDTLTVLAWLKRDDGKGYSCEQARVNHSDGSYVIDGLSDKPCYVMAIDWQAAKNSNARPPIYYPSTFSRDKATLITFNNSRSVDNVDITLKRGGGLIIEGTVRSDAGEPVPEAFVVAYQRDMLFDFVTAYTDKQGHYEIDGLGPGKFLVDVDAAQRGLVRTRVPVDIDGAQPETQLDFTLTKGVTISGKFVDEKGNKWLIGRSFGSAYVENRAESTRSYSSFSLTSFRNKYGPKNVGFGDVGDFALGEGDYTSIDMLFPTKSTFIIQGMMPGHTMIRFSPKKVGQDVVKILHDGQDILKSGIDTTAGQDIKDVTIVVGATKK